MRDAMWFSQQDGKRRHILLVDSYREPINA